MRSNKWQQIAQTLRFECPAKEGIIRMRLNNDVGWPGILIRLDMLSRARENPTGR
jgi:hypothetical protein